MTPLHVAAEGAHHLVVNYLIDQKADIEAKANNGVNKCDHTDDHKLVLSFVSGLETSTL